VTITANPAGLAVGVYTTTVSIAVTGQANVITLPVTLVVTNNPVLHLSQTSLTFNGNAGSNQSPASQTVQLTAIGTGNIVPFTATANSPWLTVTPASGNAPAALTISANPSTLAAGNFPGTVTVRPNNGDQYALTISVNFNTASTQSVLSAGPPVLLFSAQTNQQPPQSQLVQITTTQQGATPVNFTVSTFTVSTANCPSNWLSVAGPSGASGASGTSGTSGASGASGATGFSGATGTSGAGAEEGTNVGLTVGIAAATAAVIGVVVNAAAGDESNGSTTTPPTNGSNPNGT